MNWKSIVIGTDAAGKQKLLKAGDVSPDDQRAFVTAFLNGKDLPKDIVKVELVTAANGVVKTAALRAAETPEEAVTRSVRSLSHDAILAELVKPGEKVKANKMLAECALVEQRLKAPAPKPSEPVGDTAPAGMGDEPKA